MPTVTYRPDYAKFVFVVQAGTWHQYSERFHEASHKAKFSGEWLKSHKMNPWYGDAALGTETWSVDIWGEWAGLVEQLPVEFFRFLRRFDVRATVWDTDGDTIVSIGQHLVASVTSHNIHLFATKPATKRMGRDRGGKGFAIGSHKSDLRVTVYKRTGEPCAQEFQCSGTMLRNIVGDIADDPTIIPMERSPWRALIANIRTRGEQRVTSIWASAGLGVHWPVLGPTDLPKLPPIQSSALFRLPAADDDDDRAADAQYRDGQA
jgi:hypothetical protein